MIHNENTWGAILEFGGQNMGWKFFDCKTDTIAGETAGYM